MFEDRNYLVEKSYFLHSFFISHVFVDCGEGQGCIIHDPRTRVPGTYAYTSTYLGTRRSLPMYLLILTFTSGAAYRTGQIYCVPTHAINQSCHGEMLKLKSPGVPKPFSILLLLFFLFLSFPANYRFFYLPICLIYSTSTTP